MKGLLTRTVQSLNVIHFQGMMYIWELDNPLRAFVVYICVSLKEKPNKLRSNRKPHEKDKTNNKTMKCYLKDFVLFALFFFFYSNGKL